MIEPWDKGLVATTVRYPYEIRDAKQYFDEIPNIEIEPDTHKLAEQNPPEENDRLRSLAVRGSLRGSCRCNAQE